MCNDTSLDCQTLRSVVIRTCSTYSPRAEKHRRYKSQAKKRRDLHCARRKLKGIAAQRDCRLRSAADQAARSVAGALGGGGWVFRRPSGPPLYIRNSPASLLTKIAFLPSATSKQISRTLTPTTLRTLPVLASQTHQGNLDQFQLSMHIKLHMCISPAGNTE